MRDKIYKIYYTPAHKADCVVRFYNSEQRFSKGERERERVREALASQRISSFLINGP